MPTHKHYAEVAKALRREVNGREFKSIKSVEITDMLREASGESVELSDSTAAELECALLKENVRVFPHLRGDVEADQVVRLFAKRGAVAEFLDALTQPSDATNVRLAEMIRKFGGMKSLLQVDDDLINRLESIFDLNGVDEMQADGKELTRELRQKRLEEATRPKGRVVDQEFIDAIDRMREIVRKGTSGRKLTDSVDIIREMREERDEHLQRVIWGDSE